MMLFITTTNDAISYDIDWCYFPRHRMMLFTTTSIYHAIELCYLPRHRMMLFTTTSN